MRLSELGYEVIKDAEFTDLTLLPSEPGRLSYLSHERFIDQVHGPVLTNLGSRPRPYDLTADWGAAYLEDLWRVGDVRLGSALMQGAAWADDPADAFWLLHERLVMGGFYPKRDNEVGEFTRIHPTATIGSEPFGLDRKRRRVTNAGYVKLGDRVYVGAQTCIDRSVFGWPTEVGDDTNIDNLVHVAHNVRIGKRCTIIAGTVIGGSAVIGDDVFIGIGALIRPNVRIGDEAFIGMGVVVTRDVAPGERLTVNSGSQSLRYYA